MLENDLRSPVLDFFLEKGYRIFNEVRLFNRNIDIIAKKRNRIVATELKLADWQKVISQAWLNLRVTDYSYIALPDATFARNGRKIFRAALDNGIGIISVNGIATELLPPVRSVQVLTTLRKQFVQKITSE